MTKTLFAGFTSLQRISPGLGLGLALGLGLLPAAASAQVVPVPVKPVVGSSNPATPEPAVSVPPTAPCTVTLFSNEAFNDYSAHPVTYTPPTGSGCAGPWAKVVLTIDFTVTAGRQFDRTASLYLGNANIYFGTTAEPSAKFSPSWHVERDVTDLSPIFKTAEQGQAIVYNVVDSTYTGMIYGTAKLQFYPATVWTPPPTVPTEVVPVSGTNSPYSLNTGADQVTATFTAPRNTTKAYLDVIAESQQTDEQWFLCVPSNVATELESCPNTAFRETEITIDGQPAGVAPVYPWIYTGGLDPYLWRPITGLQTLNFKPYRVDLTPFAGLLADGKQHTIAYSVYNANNRFDATANLLLYTDPMSTQTSGGILENTLTAPTPIVTPNLKTDGNGDTVGTVTVTSKRTFTIQGYVNSSAGRVVNTVTQTVDFKSKQIFNVGENEDQDAVQTSTVHSRSTEKVGPLETVTVTDVSFPITLDYTFTANADGTYSQNVLSVQGYDVSSSTTQGAKVLASSTVDENVESVDTLGFNAAFAITSDHPHSSASYTSSQLGAGCVHRSIASINGVLVAETSNKSCSAD